MIYFLEGPDGAGKSTLADKLAKMTGFIPVHFSYPKTQYEKDNMVSMYIDFLAENNNKIVDRCWYSEMVYGPVMRNEVNVTKDQMKILEQAAAKKGAIIIHCTNTTDTLWSRCKARGEDYVQSYTQLQDIKLAYETLMHITPHVLPVFRYEV